LLVNLHANVSQSFKSFSPTCKNHCREPHSNKIHNFMTEIIKEKETSQMRNCEITGKSTYAERDDYESDCATSTPNNAIK